LVGIRVLEGLLTKERRKPSGYLQGKKERVDVQGRLTVESFASVKCEIACA